MCISDWDFKCNLIWGINFKLKSISSAVTLASKHIAHFKSGQKWAENNHLLLRFILNIWYTLKFIMKSKRGDDTSYSQFHQRYTCAFFVRIFQQSQNVTRKMMFLRNICTHNVDEIDTCQLQRVFQGLWFTYLGKSSHFGHELAFNQLELAIFSIKMKNKNKTKNCRF